MRTTRTALLFFLPAVLILSGCSYVHLGRLPEAAPVMVGTPDEKLTRENTDLRLEKKMLQQELALTRAQGEALRSAIENRAADGDTSTRLVERLNQTSHELAALRANYAKLQGERDQAVASASEANTLKSRLAATEEKLAESLRTYTQLQGEVTHLRGDIEQARSQNIVLTEQVKNVTAENAQAQAALAQLNTELLTQKDARSRAEQDTQVLRAELTNVAPNSTVLARLRTGSAAAANSLAAEHAIEIAELKQALDTLRGTVESLSAERASLKQKVAAVEAGRGSAELAGMESKLANALRNASLLRDENTQLSATKSELENQLAQLKNAPGGSSQLQSLREQLRDAQTQASALQEENGRLRSRLSSNPAPVMAGAATPGNSNSSSIVLTPAPTAPVAMKTDAATNRNPPGVNATLVMSVPGGPRPAIVRNDGSGQRFHVVAGGDTLAKISSQYYGTPGRWGDILAANRDVLGETNNLIVGRTLRIP